MVRPEDKNVIAYIPDPHFDHLIRNLIAAAHDPADPASAVMERLSQFVMPASCRADVEAHAGT